VTVRFPRLIISLFLSLLWTACGSPRTQPATPQAAGASGAPAAQDGAGEPDSGEGEVDPTSFCERYKRMYCAHEENEDGEAVESSYDELSAEQQREVMEACEEAVREADDEMQAAMDRCLGCVGDCSSVDACLHGASLCAADYDDGEDGEAE
jgi:hypothetical protein